MIISLVIRIKQAQLSYFGSISLFDSSKFVLMCFLSPECCIYRSVVHFSDGSCHIHNGGKLKMLKSVRNIA